MALISVSLLSLVFKRKADDENGDDAGGDFGDIVARDDEDEIVVVDVDRSQNLTQHTSSACILS